MSSIPFTERFEGDGTDDAIKYATFTKAVKTHAIAAVKGTYGGLLSLLSDAQIAHMFPGGPPIVHFIHPGVRPALPEKRTNTSEIYAQMCEEYQV